jgi:hypothetical protein
LTYKELQKVAAERDDAYRAAWMYEISTNYTADQMVFLDESAKDNHTVYRHHGRAAQGGRSEVRFLHDQGIRYSVIPALTIDGYIAVRVVEDSVDGAEFFDFVVNDVVRFTQYSL